MLQRALSGGGGSSNPLSYKDFTSPVANASGSVALDFEPKTILVFYCTNTSYMTYGTGLYDVANGTTTNMGQGNTFANISLNGTTLSLTGTAATGGLAFRVYYA